MAKTNVLPRRKKKSSASFQKRAVVSVKQQKSPSDLARQRETDFVDDVLGLLLAMADEVYCDLDPREKEATNLQQNLPNLRRDLERILPRYMGRTEVIQKTKTSRSKAA